MFRRHTPRDAAVRAARRAFARSLGLDTDRHYRKMRPLDCGVTRCGLCHGDKFHGRRVETLQERRSRLRLAEGGAGPTG